MKPHHNVVEMLQTQFALFGARESCGQGLCGCCTVLVDGKPVSGCLYLAVFLDGADLVTVEHLGRPGKLDPVQEAFIEAGAFQCGYCTPGFVLMTERLLDANPGPRRRPDPGLPVRQSLPLCRLSRNRKCGQNGRAQKQGRLNRLIPKRTQREG